MIEFWFLACFVFVVFIVLFIAANEALIERLQEMNDLCIDYIDVIEKIKSGECTANDADWITENFLNIHDCNINNVKGQCRVCGFQHVYMDEL